MIYSTVNISFYSANESAQSVSWIPNKHYSGLYGLMKLTLTDLLPSWLNQVIVLDVDVMLASDVAELWDTFSSFSSDQVYSLIDFFIAQSYNIGSRWWD